MLEEIRRELARVSAREIHVSLDDNFEPEVGTLVRIERELSWWHLLPEQFLEMLRELPDGAGAEHVHRAIEGRATAVWHGPAPKDSRDAPT
jgi:hypothetical protein